MAFAVKSNKDIDQDILLGYLEFHHIPELKIHKDDLSLLFQQNNLSMSYMPDTIRPHDAYRRATSTAGCSVEINYNGSMTPAKLLVREVVSDNTRIMRHLVREVIDKANEKPVYATVGRFKFDRASAMLDVDWDYNYLPEYNYKQMLLDIQTLYNEWTQYHTKDTVKNIIYRMVKDLGPVSLMNRGSAVFIPKTKASTLDNIQNMVHELAPYASEPTAMTIIPIVDSLEQRDFIGKRVTGEVMHDAKYLMGEFADALNSKGALRMETVQRYAVEVMKLKDKVSEYEQLLGVTMEVLDAQLKESLTRIQSAPLEV